MRAVSSNLVALGVVVALAGCGMAPQEAAGGATTGSPAGAASATARSAPADSASADAAGGVKPCRTESLPREVDQAVKAVQKNGPFVRRKDGSTYRNQNRFLPVRAQGFYREYTVRTPGSNSAGARRVVTGGNPKQDPSWYFYTGDHYDTFCQLHLNR